MTISEELRERIAAELRSLDGYDMTDGEYIDALADAVGSGASGTLHERIADLVEPQLPERVEWPRFEDGELVRPGDDVEFEGEVGIAACIRFELSGWSMTLNRNLDLSYLSGAFGERVKRPTPKVLDADGAPINVGDTVWCVDGDEPLQVIRINASGYRSVSLESNDGEHYSLDPERLTHKRPDSWELLEDDATMPSSVYVERNGIECDRAETFETMAKDLVRRAKTLAKADE